ncbi:tetratricopeptide repeat protein [Sandarakinorhabdus sp.]|uniref:tetratricopeptide repeat protein n=1 Tax=Sandarakinorhabdus sp. TaxID=1916663 RepID=UPI00286D85E4|nr:tetratricopeptide repeat protein [Sandarakinorhabdus sp.]
MPDGAEPFGQSPETIAPLASPTADRDELSTSSPTPLFQQLHRLAFLILLAALATAVVTPAMGRPKPPKPVADMAATLVQPTPPPGPEALAMLDAAIAEGRLDNARALLAPMWASGVPDVQLRAAELALAGDSLPEAAEAFTGLIDGPLAAVARQGLGIIRLREGKEAEARPLLEQAVAADPGLARAWNALGVLADKARDWPAADVAYGKAVAAAPQDAGILANRGWSHLLRGHHEAAERDLVAALKLQPTLKPARTNLTLARAMQGRYQEAFLLSDKTSLATDLNTVGYAAMMRGDLSVAEAYLNRAMTLNPQFDRAAWANLQYLAELKAQKLREPSAGAPPR